MADLKTREQRLSRLLREFDIDEQYDRTNPRLRYVAFAGAFVDGESNAAESFSNLWDAAEWLTPDVTDDYMRVPLAVVCLHTMQRYAPRVITEVKLTKLTKGATHA